VIVPWPWGLPKRGRRGKNWPPSLRAKGHFSFLRSVLDWWTIWGFGRDAGKCVTLLLFFFFLSSSSFIHASRQRHSWVKVKLYHVNRSKECHFISSFLSSVWAVIGPKTVQNYISMDYGLTRMLKKCNRNIWTKPKPVKKYPKMAPKWTSGLNKTLNPHPLICTHKSWEVVYLYTKQE
jgi:hypothetical protein